MWEIGRLTPNKSILKACFENKILVFCPAISDSGIGLMIWGQLAKGKQVETRAFEDLREIIDIAWTAKKTGVINIPPESTFLVFESGFRLDSMPETVDIEWSNDDLKNWVKATKIDSVLITKNKDLNHVDTQPRLYATIVNTDPINDVHKTLLGGIIYDGARHPIAVSRTYVEGLEKSAEKSIFFTWPTRITKNPTSGICTTPVDTILAFDRSGSMNVGNKKPPEPLTTSKNAAVAYVDSAELVDKVGLVSFASSASNPIDHEISIGHEAVKNAILNIQINKDGLQYTNIGDGIHKAVQELTSVRRTKDSKGVIVVLTDGVANRPVDPQKPNEVNNIKYAENYAIIQADQAKSAGIQVYTIGLGKGTNEEFLRDRIATDSTHYYNAPTAADLKLIYKKISESICKPEGFITDIVITPDVVFEKSL